MYVLAFFFSLMFMGISLFLPGSVYPLESALKNGGSRDHATTATLSIVPSKDDDGAVFRCEVWNRALPEDRKLTDSVTLNVNCKFLLVFFLFANANAVT